MRLVLVSETAQRSLEDLPLKERRRLVAAFANPAQDPFRPRSGADIRKLEGTAPPKYRLRAGDFRAVYWVGKDEVRVLEIFRRGRGHRLE